MSNPFKHETRGRLTAQDRAEVFANNDGRCQGACKRKLRPGDKWQADHIIALECGGTDDMSNLQVLCNACHSLKTASDHASAGHARRGYTRHVVDGEFRRSRSWGRR